jgi:hypothetical protein
MIYSFELHSLSRRLYATNEILIQPIRHFFFTQCEKCARLLHRLLCPHDFPATSCRMRRPLPYRAGKARGGWADLRLWLQHIGLGSPRHCFEGHGVRGGRIRLCASFGRL